MDDLYPNELLGENQQEIPLERSQSPWLVTALVAATFLVALFVLVVLAVLWGAPLPAALDEAFLQPQLASPSPRTAAQDTPIIPSPQPVASPLVIPSVKTLAGGTHTFQTFNNCGPAALSMAFSYLGITENQRTLGMALRPYQVPGGDNDDKSVTLQEIALKAQEYGFVTYQRPGGTTEILEAFVSQDIPVITRTWLRLNEDIGHFRVVKGYDKTARTLTQDDSLQGKNLVYSYEDFLELWSAFNYEFLVLVPIEKKSIAEKILGDMVDEQTAWEKSLQMAQSQLSSDQNALYPQFNRSVALFALGRYQESIDAYESVAGRLPKRMLWYQLEPILAYYQLERYDKVLQMSDAILNNQNRAYSELHFLKGLIYDKRGESEAADRAFADAQKYNVSKYWRANLTSIE